VSIERSNNSSFDTYNISARLKDAVDFEHDGALVVSFEVGPFHVLYMDANGTCIQTMLIGGPGNFYVPKDNDYNPINNPDTHRCNDYYPDCFERKVHYVVQEKFFCPDPNPELFRELVGHLITIHIYPS